MTPGRRAALRGFLLPARADESEPELRIFLLISFGAAGTLARYWLQGLVQNRAGISFPAGTLAVNLAGCFLLGGVGQYALHHIVIPPEWRTGILVGFFGAFTTFSTFGWETVKMLEDGDWPHATLYVAASVVGGIFAALAGIRIADRI